MDLKISLCIPTKDRFDKFLEGYLDKYIIFLDEGLINEIVISDENGNDYNKILNKYNNYILNKKIILNKNDNVLGVFLNKLNVCKNATFDLIALIDSDNFVDRDYFIIAKDYIINNNLKENFILSPSFAKPNFSFKDLENKIITKKNLKENYMINNVLFNVGNYIITKNLINVKYNNDIIDNISAADVLYFNLLVFQQINDFSFHVIKDLHYDHVVHNNSIYLETIYNCTKCINNYLIPEYLKFDNICIVFVSNKLYFNQFIITCNELITNGNYKGEICLIIGDDLKDDKLLDNDIIINNNIIIKYFPNIEFPDEFVKVNNNINSDGRNLTKKFQWHKLYLFNTFFKNWNYIFYLDCGMKIHTDISPMLKLIEENTLFAHSDAYPTYVWRLSDQFDQTNIEYYTKLNNNYNLNIDYFQTVILLYDTKIIQEDTFDNLYNLALEYPISKTNEQGIMALYFTTIKPLWKQIKLGDENINYYDYCNRTNNSKNYIINKV